MRILPRIFTNSGASTLARLSTVGMLLAVMAIGSRRLSPDEFGLWAILYTLMNFAPSLDFGFRFGLGNRLTALKAEPGAPERQRDTFLAIFHLEVIIALVEAGFCLVVGPRFDWGSIFHLTEPAFLLEARHALPLACCLMVLNHPLSLAGSALFADQRITLASAAAVVQAVVLVVAFWLGTATHSFTRLVVFFFSANLLSGLGVTILLFAKTGWRWRWVELRKQAAIVASLARQSFDFFWLSAAAMIAASIGPLVTGIFGGGAQSAGDFMLVQRFFSLLVTIHIAALAPLAPAYTLHARQGDWDWVRAKLKFCVRVIWPLLFVGGSTALLIAHPLMLRIWTGRWLSDFPLAAMLAVGAILAGWANTYSILLNSIGAIRPQAILAVIMVAPVVILPALLGHRYGALGVALAACLCTVPGAVFCWIFARQAVRTQFLRI